MLYAPKSIVERAQKIAREMLELKEDFHPFFFSAMEEKSGIPGMAVSLNRGKLIAGHPFEIEGTTFYVGMIKTEPKRLKENSRRRRYK